MARADEADTEQVPSYTVYRADDGAKKRLVVEVSLPGITSGADLIVSVREAEASLYVRAPGRYKLSVPLGVPVDGVAEAVKFVRKKAILKATLIVLNQSGDAAAAVPSGWVGGGPESTPQHIQGNGMQHAPATPAANGHKPAVDDGGAAAAGAGSVSNDDMPALLDEDDDAAAHQGWNAGPPTAASAHKPGFPAKADRTGADSVSPPAEHAATVRGLQDGTPSRAQPAPGPIDSLPDRHSSADSTSPTTPDQAQRDDGASMYAAARARHNADAATQCVELADEALQDADSARARKFLEKAQRLIAGIECPPKLAASLKRIQAVLAALEAAANGSGSDQQQQQSTPPPGVPGSGSARSRAKRARQEHSQQQQHQQQHEQQQPQHQQQQRPSSTPAPGLNFKSPQPSPSQHDASAGAETPRAPSASSPGSTASASTTPQSPASGAQHRRGSEQPPSGSVPPGYVWCEECGTLHPAPEDDLGDMPQFHEDSSEEEKAEQQDPYEAYRALPAWRRWLQFAWLSCLLVLTIVRVLAWRVARLAWHYAAWPGLYSSFLFGSSYGRWVSWQIAQDTVWDKVLRSVSLCTCALGLYWLRWPLTLPFVVCWWTVRLAWSHCLWRPSWIGSVVTALWHGYVIGARKSRINLGSSKIAALAKHALIPAMIKFTGGRWLALFAVFLMTATSLTVPSRVDGAYGVAVFLIACRAAYLVLWKWLAWVVELGLTLLAVLVWLLPSESSSRKTSGAPGTGHLRPEVPPGADGEIRRVLSATTWYEVLEVGSGADPAVIKRAKHAKALLTHPDKTRSAVGAHEAAQRVNMAADTLLDAGKRRTYDAELAEAAEAERRAEAAQHAASSGRGMAEPPTTLDEFPPWCFDAKGQPADFLFLRCQHCEKLFFPPPTDLELSRARWCDECQRYHPARSGQGWLFSTGGLLFAKRKFYVAEYDKVWDATEYAECCGILWGGEVTPNSHMAPYSFGGGKSATAASGSNSSSTRRGRHPNAKKGKGRRR